MYISLGSSCAVSNKIRKQKNHYTLPFDWTKINLTQLKEVLKEILDDSKLISCVLNPTVQSVKKYAFLKKKFFILISSH